MKRLLVAVSILTILTILFTACVPALERQLVYWPSRIEKETPAAYDLTFEVLKLTSEDGTKLTAWAIPYRDDAPWLIYFHGNASNISQNLNYPVQLRERVGVNLLMAEYRGFYQSEGVPSEAGLYMDARTYYDYLAARGIPPEQIAIYGFSLGTGPATNLATERDAAALVLQAPYTSVSDTARSLYHRAIPDRLIHNKFDSASKIRMIHTPLLVLHSKEDKTIPFAQGQALYGLAVQPKTFVAFTGGHNTLSESNVGTLEDVTQAIVSFLQDALSLPATH